MSLLKALVSSSVPKSSFPGDLIHYFFLNRWKFTLFPMRPMFLKIMDSSKAWLLESKQPPLNFSDQHM